MEILNFEGFLTAVGANPFVAMWFLFTHGGWIAVIIAILWAGSQLWLRRLDIRESQKQVWILLSIRIPRLTEQTPRAVENIFAHLAGMHSPKTFTEKWFKGGKQDIISVEIASLEGRVQFLVYTTRGFRDLIEASIFAQYPDAEISEMEDYTKTVPSIYPDAEWDLFGVEMIPVKSDVYPLRTYTEFEDKVSGEFKDPLAVLLENMSRLGPGEQAWYQIVLLPIAQTDFRAKGETTVKKLVGEKVVAKQGVLEQIVLFPLQIIKVILETAGIIPTPEAPKDSGKKDTGPFGSRHVLQMTSGEKKVVEAIENKMSKIVFGCKIRFVYVAKKEVMQKKRIVHPFIGAMKQFNTNDLQSIKPESKRVGMNGTLLFFKEQRNNARKNRLIRAYRSRSDWVGAKLFAMNIEELATLWHFPISMQVKAPQLEKTEAKRAEPPVNLPYG